MLLTLFACVLLPIYTSALSATGNTCYDDSACAYFCSSNECQDALPLWAKCSGNFIHPRECGSSRYCDTMSLYTCQWLKNTGDYCTYSYSCLSGYCDYRTSTCQAKNSNDFNWITPILVPSVIVFVIFITLVSVIIACRRRQRALACYQNPYVVLPSGNPHYSYQNSYCVGEAPPPPYPVAIHAPSPKPYQG
jgi:hypothetical protein